MTTFTIAGVATQAGVLIKTSDWVTPRSAQICAQTSKASSVLQHFCRCGFRLQKHRQVITSHFLQDTVQFVHIFKVYL